MFFNGSGGGVNDWSGGSSPTLVLWNINYGPIKSVALTYDYTGENGWVWTLTLDGEAAQDALTFAESLSDGISISHPLDIKFSRGLTTNQVTITPTFTPFAGSGPVDVGSWVVDCDPGTYFSGEKPSIWSASSDISLLVGPQEDLGGDATSLTISTPKIGTTQGGTDLWVLDDYSVSDGTPPWDTNEASGGYATDGDGGLVISNASWSGDARFVTVAISSS